MMVAYCCGADDWGSVEGERGGCTLLYQGPEWADWKSWASAVCPSTDEHCIWLMGGSELENLQCICKEISVCDHKLGKAGQGCPLRKSSGAPMRWQTQGNSLETRKWEFCYDQSKTEQEYCLVSRSALLSAPAGTRPSQPCCTFPEQKNWCERFPRAVQLFWSGHLWVGRLQSVEAVLVAAPRLCHLKIQICQRLGLFQAVSFMAMPFMWSQILRD